MDKFIVLLSLMTVLGCNKVPNKAAVHSSIKLSATATSTVTATATPVPHKITLNIISTDKAADGCSLSDEVNGIVALGCKPGCVIKFENDGKISRSCPSDVKAKVKGKK